MDIRKKVFVQRWLSTETGSPREVVTGPSLTEKHLDVFRDMM